MTDDKEIYNFLGPEFAARGGADSSNVRLLRSVDELREHAGAWDDLWRRSAVATPTARAELLAQWIEQFSPHDDFAALVVAHDDRFVAALPLVGGRVARCFTAGKAPSNEWAPGGELLIDPEENCESVLATLAEGLAQTPWPLLWFDAAVLTAPRWAGFSEALVGQGLAVVTHESFRSGRIDCSGDWEQTTQSWSRNHRRSIKRLMRRLEESGDLQFRLLKPQDDEEIDRLMRRCFEVENRGWKGRQGSSVLSNPTMLDFYCRQAKQLASWGALRLAFLELDERPIAVEYGWTAKGVYHSFKIGYDEEFAHYSPGQLLNYCLMKAFHADDEVQAIDCMGPLNESIERWRPQSYSVGRLAAAPRATLGKCLLLGYKNIWRPLRDWGGGRS